MKQRTQFYRSTLIFINQMQDTNLYLAQLSVGTCKLNSPVDKKISLAFRIGKNVAHSTHPKAIEEGMIEFNTILQLNTTKLALETQRCSLVLTSQNDNGQKIAIGLVLINIPKDNKLQQNKYKLMQCLDKHAEVELTLRIVSLEDNNNSSIRTSTSRAKESETSVRSILEMKEFCKEVNNPLKALTNRSQTSENSNLFSLSPSNPNNNRQKSINLQTLSTCSQAIEQVKVQSSAKEEKCLKELLKLQIQKNQEANILIKSLQQSLRQIRKEIEKKDEWDQTFLLEDLTKQVKSENSQTIDKFQELTRRISELTLKNQFLIKQNRELQDLVLKLSDFTQQNMKLLDPSTQNNVDEKNYSQELLERLQSAQILVAEWQKKFENLNSQINHLQQTLKVKEQQYQHLKKRMKIEEKFSSLKHVQLQITMSPIHAIELMMQRQISEKKQMLRLLLNFIKQENESGMTLIKKIKMKVQKSFNTLATKRLSKELLMTEKGQLMKYIEQLSLKSLIQ